MSMGAMRDDHAAGTGRGLSAGALADLAKRRRPLKPSRISSSAGRGGMDVSPRWWMLCSE